jgi:uncharacterized membrane protein YGL010W
MPALGCANREIGVPRNGVPGYRAYCVRRFAGVYRGGQAERWSMPALDKYMAQYDHEHTNVWNKVLHGVGIPIILVGILLAVLTYWRTGLALFVVGWVLLLAGHRIEGNKPAFFQGTIYFLVGPIWVAKEIKDAIFGTSQRSTAEH